MDFISIKNTLLRNIETYKLGYANCSAIILGDEENAAGPHQLLRAKSNGKTQ